MPLMSHNFKYTVQLKTTCKIYCLHKANLKYFFSQCLSGQDLGHFSMSPFDDIDRT